MTREKLKYAVELNSRINKLERSIENLQNNKDHRIASINARGNTCIVVIPQEVVDFAIDYFITEKNKLEKELEEL